MATIGIQQAAWDRGAPELAAAATTTAAAATDFAKLVATGGFGLLLVMNVILSPWKVAGFPLRGLVAAALLGTLLLLCFDRTVAALQKNKLLLALAAGLAVEGTFVSIVNHADPAELFSQLVQVHVQTVVTIIVAATLATIAGPRLCTYAILAVVGLSGAVAVLQMLDLHQAWAWRQALGDFSNQDMDDFQPFAARRPMGLSYSPIQLATQLCLMFGVYASVREIERRRPGTSPIADPMVVAALAIFFALCVASGTRSPILGGAVFFGIYALTRRGSWLPFLMFFGAAAACFAAPMIISMFQSTQPRVLRVVDNSSDGHYTLAYYGILLFLDNPLGYGLTFQPFEHWAKYWNILYTMPSPTGVQSKELHNYALNMLTTYGIGLFLFVPWVIRLLVRGRASLLFFVPYVIQIMFHNAGPFWTDAIIWFAIAAISVAEPGSAAPIAPPTALARRFARPVRMAPIQPVRSHWGPRNA